MQNIIKDHRPGYRRLDADAERLLSSFGDHLPRDRLSDERHARFLVRWVRTYLCQTPPHPSATAAAQSAGFAARGDGARRSVIAGITRRLVERPSFLLSRGGGMR